MLDNESVYKLYYFNVTGLAEPIRYLLYYCGIPFEDIRLDYTEEWPKHKAKMPMEQVPVLEIDGVRYHQHLAICRYIAGKKQLTGSNDEEACRISAIAEDINDMRIAIGLWYKEDEPSMKAVLKERALRLIPFYMGKFEALIEKNDGFFVGRKVSWVDIYYAAMIEFMMGKLLKEDLEEGYPRCKQVSTGIRSHMMIALHIAKRPKTDI